MTRTCITTTATTSDNAPTASRVCCGGRTLDGVEGGLGVSGVLEGEELGDNVATGGSDDDDGMSAGVAVAVAIACIFALLCILAASYAFVMLRRFKQTNLVIKRTHNSAPETAHAVPVHFEAASIVQEARRMDAAIQDRIQANGDGGRVADTLRQTEAA